MATSPIYSWPEPDNTDLVKNGALAMRTLGNAIDTTMATMTPKSVVDAKGDLIAATANDTPARLAVGNNGEVLVADSTTSTGLRYQGSQAAGRNAIINGGFDIAQRGTSFATTGKIYTVDRWEIWSTGVPSTSVVNRVAGTNGAQYALEFGRQVGATAALIPQLAQTIETANATQYAGKSVVVSFEALKGANYSGGALTVNVITGTGTDQNFTAFTGSSSNNTTFTLTSSNAFYTTPAISIPAGTTEIALTFAYTCSGTAGAADYVRVQKVQLELGSVATNFTRAAGTIQGELAACQRYYYRTSGGNAYYLIGSGYAQSATTAAGIISFPVTMRTTPTTFSNGSLYVEDSGAAGSVTSTATFGNASTISVKINLTSLIGVAPTAHRPVLIYTNNSTSSFVAAEAEL